MFGSVGFMVHGKLCLAARETRIMCRIDPEHLPTWVQRPGAQPVVMKGRRMKGYVYVDADSLGSPAALRFWVDAALRYNQTLRA